LLVGNASTITEFCNACHGDTAPGASTNVVSGVFDSGPSAGGASGGSSGSMGAHPADPNTGFTGDGGAVPVTSYSTASTFGAPLNGGGFDRMPDPYAWQAGGNLTNTVSFVSTTSAHKMDAVGPLWGSGSAVSSFGGANTPGAGPGLVCTDCHDPHGSSNYRLLKAKPNPAVGAPTVGGYASDGQTPNPFVFSNEVGYPIPSGLDNPGSGTVYTGTLAATVGGFLKGVDGATQVTAYRPDYTDTNGTVILNTTAQPQTLTATKSISTWCAACHSNYNQRSAGTAVSYDYSPYFPGVGTAAAAGTPGTTQVGTTDYHRHAVDQNMAAGTGATRALAEQTVAAPAWVPLENNAYGSAAAYVGGTPGALPSTNDYWRGYIGCLTCHRAHGSSVSMSTTGWASAHLVKNLTTNVYMPVKDNVMGVDPDKGVYNGTYNQGTSALLRANDRGVCERCHNK
jgi:hypothetical protein